MILKGGTSASPSLSCLVYANVHTHESHRDQEFLGVIPYIPETAAIFSGALETSEQL